MNKKLTFPSIFFLLLRISVGVFFLYTGLSKIVFISGFADDIYNYRLFPEFIINLAAVFMPFFEINLGLFIIIGLWLKETTMLVLLSLLSFIIMISSALIRGLDISCGCFGYGKGQLETTMMMDIAMFIPLAFSLFYKNHILTLDKLIRKKDPES